MLDEKDPGRAPGRWEKVVSYVRNDNGHIQSVLDDGFVESNMVHSEAWNIILTALGQARAEVEAKKRSPLYYHMVSNLFNERMLSQYAGIATWRIKRHLRPDVFAKLSDKLLNKYAWIFKISVDELRTLPEQDKVQGGRTVTDIPLPDETSSKEHE